MNNHTDAVSKATIDFLTVQVKAFESENRRIFATSSFQTQSVPLLHIIGRNFPQIKILFLDTRFLFPETYRFKKDLEKLFDLDVITLHSDSSLAQQKDSKSGLLQYALNPDYCCYINKVLPLENFLKPGDVWISGVRRDQTTVRKEMNPIEVKQNGVVKFHPMLEWRGKDVYYYIKKHNLPKHPLENEGYVSIGCIPCTYKWSDGDKRGGRWVGSKKTECGIHTSK